MLEKLAHIRDTIDANGFMFNFSYAGMPYQEAERNLKCFVKNVIPELRKWNGDPIGQASPTLSLGSPASAP